MRQFLAPTCLFVALVALSAPGSAEASLNFFSNFYDVYSGNSYLHGAGSAAGLVRIELRIDNPGGGLDAYGNSAIGSFGGAVGGEYRVERYAAGNSTYNPYYYDPEGATTTGWVYKTFCIEQGIPLNESSPYYATIDPWALTGLHDSLTAVAGDGTGLPVGTSYDPLSAATKLLYGLYFEGRLHGEYNWFRYNDNASANALQETFWLLEDTPADATKISTAAANLRDWALARASTDHTYDQRVAALNLWSNYDASTNRFSGDSQTQLVYVPRTADIPSEPQVPEPATLAVWSIATTLLCVGRFMRGSPAGYRAQS